MQNTKIARDDIAATSLHPSDINNHRPWILKETCLNAENL
jgi:hypothetical protein